MRIPVIEDEKKVAEFAARLNGAKTDELTL